MLVCDLFRLMEDETAHWDALAATGYYGKQAAGVIPFARKTQRFLLAHRSRDVEQPGHWGTWGGAIEPGEDPQAAALRELYEESGYAGPIEMRPLYVFRDKKFKYSNFLAVIDHEFTPPSWQPYPQRGWETQGFRWCNYGDWPEPLHFGLIAVFHDAASVATMQQAITASE